MGGKKNECNKEKTVTNVVDINITISIMNLNVNGPNTPINRQILSEWRKRTHKYLLSTT